MSNSSSKGVSLSSQSPTVLVHLDTFEPWIRVRVRAILVRKDRRAGTWWLRQKYTFSNSMNSSDLVRSPSNTGGNCPIAFTSGG